MRNWFDRGGDAYRQFRPTYPPLLSQWLAATAPDTALAVDVGCGSGQLTAQLAGVFDAVIGIDPSESQIASATPHERVRYVGGPAEALPVDDAQASVLTVAQAVHWFDREAFFAEVRRVVVDGGLVALICYAAPELPDDVAPVLQRFYSEQIGPYWSPERVLVDTGYATLDFPFGELGAPPLEVAREWPLDALLGYVSTWSAVRRAGEEGRPDLFEDFSAELARRWGDPASPRPVRWPIHIRAGVVG